MIILTFDDPVTDRTINIYKSLFDGHIRNPNGCGIKGEIMFDLFLNIQRKFYGTTCSHANFRENL